MRHVHEMDVAKWKKSRTRDGVGILIHSGRYLS